MPDVSYLLNVIPNPVVSKTFPSTNPARAGQAFLLGDLPEDKVFLVNKVSTSVRDALSRTAQAGLLILNTDNGQLEQFLSGTDWQPFQLPLPNPSQLNKNMGLVSTGVAYDTKVVSPITAEGDIAIGGPGGVPIRLPISTLSSSNTSTNTVQPVLTAVNGMPAWGSGLSTLTTGT